MKKKISIIGSTGSVGKQALEVIENFRDRFEIIALAAGSNAELLKEQSKKFKPKYICLGEHGIERICMDKENDIILFACSGIVGLKPMLTAIENGIDIALANKESIVLAGDFVMQKAKKHGVNIIPVDSEHSAIHQCLRGNRTKDIEKLIITASGGPFLYSSAEEIQNATVKDALAHPRWDMGKKISIDSANMTNKGFEIIEAHHLFGIPYDKIEVVVHPQSIIHGAIEFKDGSIIAQLGQPSMHIPVQYALTYPERIVGIKSNSLSLSYIAKLDFMKPDFEKFPCLAFTIECGKKGGTAPAALNGANDEAVMAFLDGKIKFGEIYVIVKATVEKHAHISNPTLKQVLSADKNAREFAKMLILNK